MLKLRLRMLRVKKQAVFDFDSRAENVFDKAAGGGRGDGAETWDTASICEGFTNHFLSVRQSILLVLGSILTAEPQTKDT